MNPETPYPLEQVIARSGSLDTLLRDLTDRAVEAEPGAAACSITVRRADRLMTLAGSGGLPSGLDLRQYENGTGPCVAAAETGTEQYASDLAAERRWPAYTKYALSVGVRCTLALPLAVEGETGAAINFYGLQRGVSTAFSAGCWARAGRRPVASRRGPRTRSTSPCASNASAPRYPTCARPCSPAASSTRRSAS
ncbi:GAF domain-containing protein [Streptomyces sp. NPDC005202]|uniref:GAF domain-containing protein n=1 Tax=Streptomyces sp. NPDC005202 TaxID=3157021 RepID=UPI0033A3BA97